MNVVDDSAYDLGHVPVLKSYADRVARWILLRHWCKSEDDLILAIERDLIEMAKSRLQEFLLSSFRDNADGALPIIIVAVKRVAAQRIRTSEIDQEVKFSLLRELDNMPMEDLLIGHH
jgi:hypothetical protein